MYSRCGNPSANARSASGVVANPGRMNRAPYAALPRASAWVVRTGAAAAALAWGRAGAVPAVAVPAVAVPAVAVPAVAASGGAAAGTCDAAAVLDGVAVAGEASGADSVSSAALTEFIGAAGLAAGLGVAGFFLDAIAAIINGNALPP